MTEPIWIFETAHFTVRVDALPEEDWDFSWDESGDARDGLDSGRYVGFCARAQVLDHEGGVLAEDYLGNCIYGSLSEFGSVHRDSDPLNRNSSIMRASRGGNVVICHYFPDMVRIACRQARRTLRRHASCRLRRPPKRLQRFERERRIREERQARLERKPASLVTPQLTARPHPAGRSHFGDSSCPSLLIRNMPTRRVRPLQPAASIQTRTSNPSVKDLLVDLGHLCDAEGIDFVERVKKALNTWSVERIDPASVADGPVVEIYIGAEGLPPQPKPVKRPDKRTKSRPA